VAATRQSSLEVEDALLRAGERLGMKVILLRLVAAELPDNPWLLDLRVERDGPNAMARATHLCGEGCRMEATGCLTAFKIEDAVSKTMGQVMSIASLARGPGDEVRVALAPLARSE
jgi:hypothetical protein